LVDENDEQDALAALETTAIASDAIASAGAASDDAATERVSRRGTTRYFFIAA
jgi:hypothetical protein